MGHAAPISLGCCCLRPNARQAFRRLDEVVAAYEKFGKQDAGNGVIVFDEE
jgi:hypothetical protein